MKGKLIKVDNGWILLVDNIMYATDNDKLSIKNCQAIERGYDLDELAIDYIGETDKKNWVPSEYNEFIAFKEGFQKALELMGEKKFSLEDMKKAYLGSSKYEWFGDLIQSLQQTEWDVEIEMESSLHIGEIVNDSYPKDFPTEKPKLDQDKCLILKKNK